MSKWWCSYLSGCWCDICSAQAFTDAACFRAILVFAGQSLESYLLRVNIPSLSHHMSLRVELSSWWLVRNRMQVPVFFLKWIRHSQREILVWLLFAHLLCSWIQVVIHTAPTLHHFAASSPLMLLFFDILHDLGTLDAFWLSLWTDNHSGRPSFSISDWSCIIDLDLTIVIF